jgi:hypothetical protein
MRIAPRSQYGRGRDQQQNDQESGPPDERGGQDRIEEDKPEDTPLHGRLHILGRRCDDGRGDRLADGEAEQDEQIRIVDRRGTARKVEGHGDRQRD